MRSANAGSALGDAASARLAAFSRVSTADPDEAAELIGRIFCPHALEPLGKTSADFHAVHNCAVFDGFSVNYVGYGGSVSIDPGCLDRFFLLQMPLRGRASVHTGGRAVESAAGRSASLLSPTMPTRMVWQDDCAKLILLLDRSCVEAAARDLAERPATAVEFAPEVDLCSPLGDVLQAQLAYIVALAEAAGPSRGLSRIQAATLRESLINLLLTGQRHSLSDAVHGSSHRETLPATYRRAWDHLEAHAAEPFDLAGLARACGVGIRSLQIGFKRHFGVSISTALQDIRLRRLNRLLSRAGPDARVTDIAFDLGFNHLSRMARAYRAKFGESPSATLRCRR